MNQKRSHNNKKSLSSRETNRIEDPTNQTELDKLLAANRAIEPTSDLHQSTLLNRFLRFEHQYYCRSHFRRGLFWGGLVSLTSIGSALAGMALTKIDFVEQQISYRLARNPARLAGVELSTIEHPLQILLVEVKSDAEAMVEFDRTATGKSKTILLLKLDPELNLAQAVNIPADTKAKIPGIGTGTIQDAYRLGGMDLLSQTVNGLDENIQVNRYLRTSEEVFRQLSDSGKITLKKCDPRVRDCRNLTEQIIRQETAFTTIRQRFNIPTYLASFEATVARIESQLDTDISAVEIMEVANFIKELEPDRLNVELVAQYAPGRSIASNDTARSNLATPTLNPSSAIAQNDSQTNRRSPTSYGKTTTHHKGITSREIDIVSDWQYVPIAVQNTTNNPELGRRVVAYLRQQNFRDVYLVKQIPLKLKQTKIVADRGQIEGASHLKNVLGFGNLDSSSLPGQELVLQLGEDALYLTSDRDKR